MLYRFLIDIKFRHLAVALAMLAFAVIWVSNPQSSSGANTAPDAVVVQELTAPSGFAAADPDPDTAFREEDAGISAFLRVGAKSSGSSDPRLDVNAIVNELTTVPEDPAVRSQGKLIELGLNFGIVELPMFAAVISAAPVENVTVYFDDEGWIVAYLPHDRPAAALCKHGSAAGASASDPQADRHLESNLLALAVNEVMTAQDTGSRKVDSSDVTYYDWTCPACDAMALFTGVSRGGTQDEIKFVVPHTISLVQPSAAVVITEPIETGGNATASVSVDGAVIVSADADHPLNTKSFHLRRDVESTSLHRVAIGGPSDNVAVGAIMLLYDRP